jgi:hypothetical protein
MYHSPMHPVNLKNVSRLEISGGLVEKTSQLAEKLKFLSFRGALRAEESLFSRV